MSSTPQLAKSAELRAKTDRQLLGIVSRALEQGLDSAGMADRQYELGDQAQAEGLLARAERAYNESCMLLTVLYGATHQQRTALEQRLRELREKLDALYERQQSQQYALCAPK